jgi:hypothetical protein
MKNTLIVLLLFLSLVLLSQFSLADANGEILCFDNEKLVTLTVKNVVEIGEIATETNLVLLDVGNLQDQYHCTKPSDASTTLGSSIKVTTESSGNFIIEGNFDVIKDATSDTFEIEITDTPTQAELFGWAFADLQNNIEVGDKIGFSPQGTVLTLSHPMNFVDYVVDAREKGESYQFVLGPQDDKYLSLWSKDVNLLLTKKTDSDAKVRFNEYYVLEMVKDSLLTTDGRYLYLTTPDLESQAKEKISILGKKVIEGKEEPTKQTYSFSFEGPSVLTLNTKFEDATPYMITDLGTKHHDFTIESLQDNNTVNLGLFPFLLNNNDVLHVSVDPEGDLSYVEGSTDNTAMTLSYDGTLTVSADSTEKASLQACGSSFLVGEESVSNMDYLGKGTKIAFTILSSKDPEGVWAYDCAVTSCLFNGNGLLTSRETTLQCVPDALPQVQVSLPYKGLRFTQGEGEQDYWSCDDRSCGDNIAFVLDPTEQWTTVKNIGQFKKLEVFEEKDYFKLTAKNFAIGERTFYKFDGNPIYLKKGSVEVYGQQFAVKWKTGFLQTKRLFLNGKDPALTPEGGIDTSIIPARSLDVGSGPDDGSYVYGLKLSGQDKIAWVDCCNQEGYSFKEGTAGKLFGETVPVYGCQVKERLGVDATKYGDLSLLQMTPLITGVQCGEKQLDIEDTPPQVEEVEEKLILAEATVVADDDKETVTVSTDPDASEEELAKARAKAKKIDTCGTTSETKDYACSCSSTQEGFDVKEGYCYSSDSSNKYCCKEEEEEEEVTSTPELTACDLKIESYMCGENSAILTCGSEGKWEKSYSCDPGSVCAESRCNSLEKSEVYNVGDADEEDVREVVKARCCYEPEPESIGANYVKYCNEIKENGKTICKSDKLYTCRSSKYLSIGQEEFGGLGLWLRSKDCEYGCEDFETECSESPERETVVDDLRSLTCGDCGLQPESVLCQTSANVYGIESSECNIGTAISGTSAVNVWYPNFDSVCDNNNNVEVKCLSETTSLESASAFGCQGGMGSGGTSSFVDVGSHTCDKQNNILYSCGSDSEWMRTPCKSLQVCDERVGECVKKFSSVETYYCAYSYYYGWRIISTKDEDYASLKGKIYDYLDMSECVEEDLTLPFNLDNCDEAQTPGFLGLNKFTYLNCKVPIQGQIRTSR